MFKNNPLTDNPVISAYFNKMVEIFSSTHNTEEDPGPDPSAITSPDYTTYKVSELKAEAKARGYKGYTRLKKAELIDLLNKNQ